MLSLHRAEAKTEIEAEPEVPSCRPFATFRRAQRGWRGKLREEVGVASLLDLARQLGGESPVA